MPVGVRQELLELDTSLGRVPGLIYRPDDDSSHPAVVIGMEATGINSVARTTGQALAEAGYVVVIPDYYRGGGPPDPGDLTDIPTIVRHIGALDFSIAARDMTAAIDYATSLPFVDAARIGVWGWCTGATFSWLGAALRPDVKAAVLFYPSQPFHALIDDAHPVHPMDVLWAVRAKTLLIVGDQDGVFTADVLSEFERRCRRYAIDHRIEVMAGAGHAFSNPAPGFYHHDAEVRALAIANPFLADALQPAP
ncbi:MAG: dienelactone hydrolase family protein [Acidimicrobiia bacterium]